jgi:hypothetical protein
LIHHEFQIEELCFALLMSPPAGEGGVMVTPTAWFISHQPAVLFSHNKPATSNQPAVLFSQNKPAPAISHQPTEQAGPSPLSLSLSLWL